MSRKDEFSETTPDQPGVVPEPALRRLPWYLAYVTLLRRQGTKYVSSTTIARELNVDASRIAKDLSFLSLKGKTRIGYEVKALEVELRDFLGFQKVHNAVIAGCGSLGSALIQDRGLTRYGLNILAGIDTAPGLNGSKLHGVPVFGPEQLPELVESLELLIGIITVPIEYAAGTAELMVDCGIKSIWNFTPMRLNLPADVVVTNTSIYANLAVMYNRMRTHQ